MSSSKFYFVCLIITLSMAVFMIGESIWQKIAVGNIGEDNLLRMGGSLFLAFLATILWRLSKKEEALDVSDSSRCKSDKSEVSHF